MVCIALGYIPWIVSAKYSTLNLRSLSDLSEVTTYFPAKQFCQREIRCFSYRFRQTDAVGTLDVLMVLKLAVMFFLRTDKQQQQLYASVSSSPSPTLTPTVQQLKLNSRDIKPTTAATSLSKVIGAAAAADEDAKSLSRRQRCDLVAAMSRITMGVQPASSRRLQSGHNRCKYGVETNDLAALERVRNKCRPVVVSE